MNKHLSKFKIAITVSCLVSIAPAYPKDVLLKGAATKQNIGTNPKDGENSVAKPSFPIIEQYSEAARSPRVEAAIKSAERDLIQPTSKRSLWPI